MRYLDRVRIPILTRYILSEIFAPFAACLFVFTGVLFLVRVLKLVELVVSKNVPITDVLLLFSYVIPRFLEVALPMSLLLGVILAFSRLSIDSELVVLRATGISLKQLAVPVVIFAAIVFVASLAIALWVRPWANYRLGLGIFEIAKMRASAGLVAGVFNELGPLTIYSERIEDDGERLHNVIISDHREDGQSRTFIAKDGMVVGDSAKRTLTLRLFDGSIHQSTGLNYDLTNFDINNISLEEDELLEGGPTKGGKKSNEMFLEELSSSVAGLKSKLDTLPDDERRTFATYLVEWHSRFAIPLSCFFVAVIAMALGIQPSRGGHAWGTVANVSAGILIIILYYALFALVSALSKNAAEAVWALMWAPNVLLALLAVALFRAMESERWLALSQALGDLFKRSERALGLKDPSDSEEQAAEAAHG